MTKAEWQKHHAEIGPHAGKDCPECQARLKTRRQNQARKDRDQCMRDLGLVKVKGPVSGRIYWE